MIVGRLSYISFKMVICLSVCARTFPDSFSMTSKVIVYGPTFIAVALSPPASRYPKEMLSPSLTRPYCVLHLKSKLQVQLSRS